MFGKPRLSIDSIQPLPIFFIALQIPFLACLQTASANNFVPKLLLEVIGFAIASLILGPFFVLFSSAEGAFKEAHHKGRRDRQRMGFWHYSTSAVVLITGFHIFFYSVHFYMRPPTSPLLLIYPHYLSTALVASFCVSLFHLTCSALVDRLAARPAKPRR